MPADLDLIILGGGCAGLSLGMRLAENPGACRRVMVLESRARYVNDRTWCFWRLTPHRFDALIRYRWSKMAVKSPPRSVIVDCAKTPYQMLAADDFYAEACRLISTHGSVSLALDTPFRGEPERVGRYWQLDTPKGRITANAVIDTRPPATAVDDALLWQSFVGQEVSCGAAPFDASTVQLMDFAAASEDEVRFTYLLPMTPERALVETTVFSARQHGPAALEARQRQALQQHCGAAPYQVHRTESGLLPMGWRTPRAAPQGSLVHAGILRGGARPARGYAFERIQRWASATAHALRHGGAPATHRRDPLMTRTMDRLLLQVLRARPDLGPSLFMDLFSRADPARVIRFLSDKGTLADHLAMIAALPARPFLSALLAAHGRPSVRGATP
jgi:lycopene beta-cyclase